jgi:fibronectin type III domain protein
LGDVVLDWTAPGDDGDVGQASTYEIRYSQSLITINNYSQATICPTPPSPSTAGASQELVVSSLAPGVEYFFTVRAYDDEGLISGLSNVPSATAKSNPDPGDVTPPSAIADLAAVTGDEMGEVVLDWTAPGDDGNIGQVTSYEVRYSLGLITLDNYGQAAIYATPPNPLSAGSAQELVVSSLSPGEEYYFAVRAYDDVGLSSGLSNVPSAVSQFDFGAGDTTIAGSSSPDTSPHPYPNPYNPASGVTLSFTNVPDGSSLAIMTISGSIIRQWMNTSGEVSWNGRDDSGNMVASGVYLWYIENSDIRGKIIIRR